MLCTLVKAMLAGSRTLVSTLGILATDTHRGVCLLIDNAQEGRELFPSVGFRSHQHCRPPLRPIAWRCCSLFTCLNPWWYTPWPCWVLCKLTALSSKDAAQTALGFTAHVVSQGKDWLQSYSYCS